MIKLLFLAVSLMMIMSSCAAPVEVPVPTTGVISIPTETPTPTVTPTLEPTPTITAIPTSTPTTVPVYTELGEVVSKISQVLGWEVVICDDIVNEEDWENGVFLYREDTNEYFCDFVSLSSEPFPEPSKWESLGIYRELVLCVAEQKGLIDIHKKTFKTTHGFIVYDISDKYYIPNPSSLTADDYIRANSNRVSTLREYRLIAETYWIPLVMWPLTEDEYKKILDDSFFDTNVSYLFSPRW